MPQPVAAAASVNAEPRSPDLRYAGKWFVLSVAIGIVIGLLAVGFFTVLRASEHLFTHTLAGFHPPAPGGDPPLPAEVMRTLEERGEPPWYGLLLVPALGGLIAGAVVFLLRPSAEQGGTDAVLTAFHERRGRMGLGTPVVKAVASIVVIGSGGSVGREGPMVSLGAGLASRLGALLRLRAPDRRIALLVGAAAGFASIFRAPISGAIFAVESPYRNPEFEYQAFVPAIIGAVVAYATFSAFFGFVPVFDVPAYVLGNPLELLLYAAFGLVCAATGITYVKLLHGAREKVADRLFAALRVPLFLRPAIGGLLLGGLVLLVPMTWGTGYGWVQQAIDGELGADGLRGVLLLFGLAFAKMFATSITYGARGGEGVFGPSFFVGAMVGAGYGHLMEGFFPEIVEEPSSYVLVGMSGVFAGITKVPIAGLVMVCEITGSYGLILPLVLVCSISYIFTGRASIYRGQVLSRFDSPAHLGEFSLDVLAPLKVQDAHVRHVPAQTVARTAPIADVLALLPLTRHTTFPVVDESGFVTGVITVEDIRDFLLDTEIHRLVLVDEVASRDFPSVTPDEPLVSALRKFAEAQSEEIPILDRSVDQGPGKLVGLLSREEILAVYRSRVDVAAMESRGDETVIRTREGETTSTG